MTITELTPIGDIATEIPSSVRIFQRHGIDFCCGGRRALGAVCRERGLSFAATVSAIEASVPPTATGPDWTQEPLARLTEHIVATYHDSLREELPRLQAMAAKVAQVHGQRSTFFVEIATTVDVLTEDLLTHMRKEETILFPAIRALEEGRGGAAGIQAPISVMEHEHNRAGALLGELRNLTDGYTPPAWACATTRALYHGLEELERTMHEHVHLENNVLFPRALGQRAAAVAI